MRENIPAKVICSSFMRNWHNSKSASAMCNSEITCVPRMYDCFIVEPPCMDKQEPLPCYGASSLIFQSEVLQAARYINSHNMYFNGT